MNVRTSQALLVLVLTTAGVALVTPAAVDAQDRDARRWVMPRTPAGHPDLQGNWTNATITPIQRPAGQDRVLTPEQVAEIEGRRQDYIDVALADSDPNRGAPPVGGQFTGDPLFDAASGGTGGYNYFWIDGGDRVAIFNGEPRSSLVTSPESGRIPALTPEAQRRRAEAFARSQQIDAFENPETRGLAERCIMSFGSNAGPPMLPNYFYNNSYTIVQTPEHVMIMTEMVHDVRIIRMGEPKSLPEHMRPWMGDSWGRWEGDTLVVETTNLPTEQVNSYTYIFPGGSENFKVIERFTRADEFTVNYEFTVLDPDTYTGVWGGEVPLKRMEGQVYEYGCHEGNYALENVLRGARAQEREAGGNRE